MLEFPSKIFYKNSEKSNSIEIKSPIVATKNYDIIQIWFYKIWNLVKLQKFDLHATSEFTADLILGDF